MAGHLIDLATEKTHRLLLQELQVFRSEVYAKLYDMHKDVRQMQEMSEKALRSAEQVAAKQKLVEKLLWALLAAGAGTLGPNAVQQVMAMVGG